jgi:hypothetical protein
LGGKCGITEMFRFPDGAALINLAKL